MTVAAHEFAFRDFLFKLHIGIRDHLRHIQKFVGDVVKVEHARSIFGDKQTTVATLSTSKFCLEEAGATGCKILLLVA